MKIFFPFEGKFEKIFGELCTDKTVAHYDRFVSG